MDSSEIAKKAKAILQQIPNSESDCEKIGDYILQLEANRVNLCVTGEFSSGKSSLINALISYPLLPTADIPLTSKRTEIKYSEQPYLTCVFRHGVTCDGQRTVYKWFVAFEEERDGGSASKISDRITWDKDSAMLTYRPMDVSCMKGFLILLAARHGDVSGENLDSSWTLGKFIMRCCRLTANLILQRKVAKPFPINPDDLEKVEIGIRLPDIFKEACLLDVPGEGSVFAYDPNTKHAQQTSLLVLHVLDAEHIGSKLTENMLAEFEQNGATNVFVLNKMDAVNETSLKDAVSLLRNKYGINTIPVSALYEICSFQLTHDLCTVESVLNNRKINLSQIISSDKWDHRNPQNNRLMIVRYLHSMSNIKTLAEHVSSTITSNRAHMEQFCREKILGIVGSWKHKVKTLIDRMENPPQKELLLSEIDSMRKLCRDIEEFEKQEDRKLGSDFAVQIDSVLRDLHERLDKMMSDALSVSFDRFENKLKMTVASTLVLPISGEIRNCIDRYVTQRHNAYLEFISKHRLAVSQATSDTESCCMEEDLRKRIQEDTCLIVGPILKDTSQKPWFSFLRPGALAEYRRKKHQECMQLWRARMAEDFSQASEEAVATCRQIVWWKMMPLLNLRDEKKKDLQSREFALSNLKEALSNNSEYRRLRNVQSEFAILLEAIDQQGVKT